MKTIRILLLVLLTGMVGCTSTEDLLSNDLINGVYIGEFDGDDDGLFEAEIIDNYIIGNISNINISIDFEGYLTNKEFEICDYEGNSYCFSGHINEYDNLIGNWNNNSLDGFFYSFNN